MLRKSALPTRLSGKEILGSGLANERGEYCGRKPTGNLSHDFSISCGGARVAIDRNYGAKRFLLLRMQEQVRPVLSPRACQPPLKFSLPAIVRKSFASVFRRKQAEVSK